MTRTDYVAQVSAAVDAVTMLGPTRFAWLGVPSDHSRARNGTTLSDDAKRVVLVAALRRRLYISFFRPGGVVPAHTRVAADLSNDDHLVASLARANAGSGSWQPGWTITDTAPEGIVARRSGLSVRCELHDVSALGSGVVAVGQQVSLRMPAGSASRLPGWYLALSDEPLVDAQDVPLVRLY